MPRPYKLSPEEALLAKHGFTITPDDCRSIAVGRYKGHVYEIRAWREGSAHFASINFKKRDLKLEKFPGVKLSEVQVLYYNGHQSSDQKPSKLLIFLRRFIKAKDKVAFMVERKFHLV